MAKIFLEYNRTYKSQAEVTPLAGIFKQTSDGSKFYQNDQLRVGNPLHICVWFNDGSVLVHH